MKQKKNKTKHWSKRLFTLHIEYVYFSIKWVNCVQTFLGGSKSFKQTMARHMHIFSIYRSKIDELVLRQNKKERQIKTKRIIRLWVKSSHQSSMNEINMSRFNILANIIGINLNVHSIETNFIITYFLVYSLTFNVNIQYKSHVVFG